MLDQTDRNSSRPVSGAVPFEIDEVFFSRTDPRGVIQSFNEVFTRIADFRPDEMRNAPHRLIRHPDMPRGVFWLLWEGIKAGRKVGAYVKNRARDGLHYWVFAVVTPIDGGYVSVRLKPTSPMLAVIEAEYAALLAREKTEGLSPADSARALFERLNRLGYRSYGQFQAEAIATETMLRDEALYQRADPRIAGLVSIRDKVGEMRKARLELAGHFEAIRAIPNNLRIMASRIEPSGGPITAIATNYKTMSSDVIQHLSDFAEEDGERHFLRSQIEEDGLFILCASRLMSAVVERFAGESHVADGIDPAVETRILEGLDRQYRVNANAALQKIGQRVGALSQEADDLRRMVVGLDSIRVMCRVESGRMGHRYDGLTSIIESLDKFHSLIDDKLDEIGTAAQAVNKETSQLLRAWNSA